MGCGHVLGLLLEFYLGRAFVVWLSRSVFGTRAGLGRAELSHRLCLGLATLRLGGGDRKLETHMFYMTLRSRVPERS